MKKVSLVLLALLLVLSLVEPAIHVQAASKNEYSVKVGSKITLTTNIKKASWGSSDTSVATVTKKGVVKGVSEGSCTIAAVGSGKADIFTVEVTKAKQTTDKKTDSNREYTLKNKVIVDNDYCKVTFTSVEADKVWGPTIKVLCENKTSKTELMFAVDDVSVNGYMVDPYWATSIAAGKKENSTISFSKSSLEECGISVLDEVTFTLRVYDSNDWSADKLVNTEYTVYPTGLKANQVKIPDMPSTGKEITVVDDKNCKFVILQTYTDDILGYTLQCYLENKTSKTELMFAWDDVSVNGYMIDPYWATSVLPGKRMLTTINFSKSQFSDNGITKVKEIEYQLRIYDSNDWFADKLVSKTFKYKP